MSNNNDDNNNNNFNHFHNSVYEVIHSMGVIFNTEKMENISVPFFCLFFYNTHICHAIGYFMFSNKDI